MVTIVLPVYNERDNLALLLEEIAAALGDLPYEIVAVDDGSSDGSLHELRGLKQRFPALRVVVLQRHCGQSAACAAGIDAAVGDVIVTLDADGQNDPADIPGLLTYLEQDSTCCAVVGYRERRLDSRWKRIQSRVANAFRNWITGDRVRDTGCSLKAMRRSAVVSLPRFDGMHRFIPTLLRREGGDVLEVPVSHRRRRYGRSKYGMWGRLRRGMADAIAVRWLRRRALAYGVEESD